MGEEKRKDQRKKETLSVKTGKIERKMRKEVGRSEK